MRWLARSPLDLRRAIRGPSGHGDEPGVPCRFGRRETRLQQRGGPLVVALIPGCTRQVQTTVRFRPAVADLGCQRTRVFQESLRLLRIPAVAGGQTEEQAGIGLARLVSGTVCGCERLSGDLP